MSRPPCRRHLRQLVPHGVHASARILDGSHSDHGTKNPLEIDCSARSSSGCSESGIGNLEIPKTRGRPPFVTCSSSDRPDASQNEAYTALISAVVRGSSSVAFEPIWFIT